MISDASSGLSWMGFRSFGVPFRSRETDGPLLVRLVGAAFRAHSATKRNLSHRPKVGHYRCCAGAANVALPASYALREQSTLGAGGSALWKQFGPWFPRRLAARQSAKSRDWAAASLIVHVPDPPLRAPLRNDGRNLRTPASKPPLPQPCVGKKTGTGKLR